MIIQRSGSDLLFIPQIAHAALAADLMARWRLGGLPENPRRAAILEATRDHDDGWREEDAELHVGEGGEPLDFISVPPAVKHRIWPRAVARLGARSAYVGALVAQHALTVHERLRGEAEWADFFRTMQDARDEMLARVPGESAAAALDDYTFVRIGDLLSLTFCNAWTTPQKGTGFVARLNGTSLEIDPDPFAGTCVEFRIDAHVIPDRSYASAAELRSVYAAAPVRTLHGIAVGV